MSLDPDLAARLRRVSGRLADARAERDQLIVKALASGASARDVSEAVGLSHTGVLRIRDRLDSSEDVG